MAGTGAAVASSTPAAGTEQRFKLLFSFQYLFIDRTVPFYETYRTLQPFRKLISIRRDRTLIPVVSTIG